MMHKTILNRSLAILFASAVIAACSSQTSNPIGGARLGVSVNALTATSIDHMTLTVGVDATSGAPTFSNIVTNLTNNDLTNKLAWSAYVTGIPAGTQRVFSIQAFSDAAGANVIYSGSAHADITAGGTANISIILQGLNDGGFQNSLPVLDSLTSSASIVSLPALGPVTLTFTAHDPDAGATLTYAWASDCSGSSFTAQSGAYTAGSTQIVSWTPPTTAPVSGACTETLKITDNKSGSVTAYLAIQIITNSSGGAVVNAYPNSWPIISGIVANETFTKNAAGQLVSLEFDFVASATDTDGDDIKYTWSTVAASGCNKPGDGFTSSTVTTPATTLAQGQGQIPTSTVHFHTTDLGATCVFHVDVTDYWKNGIVPAGSGLPVARGGDTVGIINGSLATDFTIAPDITHVDGPGAPVAGSVTGNSATYSVAGGQVINLDITATDPTPSFDTSELPFSFTWTQSGGTLASMPNGLPGENSGTSPTFSANRWTAPAAVTSSMFVTVSIKNLTGLISTYTWKFVPSNPCDGSAGSVGMACNTGLGLCAPAGACTAAGTCVDPAAVVCGASDQCHAAGVCDPSSGMCTTPNLTDGTTCNADSNGCSVGDACMAGVCTAGPTAACNTPADTQCQTTAGTCVSTGNNSFTCNYTNLANNTSCNKDSNGCTQNDSCQAGACTAGTAVVCSQSADTCEATTGTCASTGNNTFSCNYAPLTDGTACGGTNACVSGQSCLAGACQGGSSACPAGDLCTVVSSAPVCTGTGVAPQVARDVQIAGPVGLSMDTSGNSYITGAIYSTTPISFDGHPVASGGDADIFLAKYDTTGTAVWAVGYGDGSGANPQTAIGSAVTNDGTLAVIGNFAGAFSIGAGSLNSSSPIDFVAFVKQADGTGITAKQFNDGGNGVIKAIAANPHDASPTHGNRVAVCGLANGGTPALPTTGVAAAGNDIIIGAFTSTGTQLWGSQFSSPGTFNDECDSVAVDENGDVWALGSTSGATLNFGGATSVLTGPGSSIKKFVWITKFNGATGAALFSAIFSGTSQATPNGIGGNSLAVDLSGNVIASGQFIGSVTFGSTTLTTAGGSDAWVAKFSSTLTPIWAERLGGTGSDATNGIAVDSFGDVIATGLFNKTATITGTTASATTIVANGTTASDVFVWKLNGNTGGTDFAAGYGDPATQTGDAVAANRYGANQITLAGTLNSSIPFPAPAGTVTATGATDVYLVTAKLQ